MEHIYDDAIGPGLQEKLLKRLPEHRSVGEGRRGHVGRRGVRVIRKLESVDEDGTAGILVALYGFL